ncbi:MAG: leucine-rich repeat protein [Clostridiales bacterium]|nr:leucine-rich repeat protein [Clostridiales bacterium]
MNKMFKKLTAAVLSVALVLALMPLNVGTAFAETDYEAALRELAEAQANAEELKAAYESAQAELESAQTNQQSAEVAYTQAVSVENSARSAFDNSISVAKADSESALNTAKDEEDQAQAELDIATNSRQDAEAALNTARSNTDTTALESAVAAAKANVADKTNQVNAAKAALEEAQAQLDSVGRDFLNAKAGGGVTLEAIKSLYDANSSVSQYSTTSKYTQELNAALTIEKLNKAADFVDECNTLRANHSLAALKINYRLMCLAVTSAAVSSQVGGHVVINAAYNGLFDSMSGMPKWPSENLSWGYTDPFDGWYTEEKADYEKFVASGNYPGMESMSAYELSKTYEDVYKAVGHYLNIIDKDVTITGFATSGSTDEQCFSSGSYGDSVTPTEFKAALSDFSQAATDAVASAEADYESAQAALNQAIDEQAQAEEALAVATADLASLEEAYNAALANEAKASAAYQAAKANAAACQETYNKAQAIDPENPETYEDFAAVVEAKAAYDKAVTDRVNADTALSEARSIVAQKTTARNTAETAYNEALQAVNAAQEKVNSFSIDFTEGDFEFHAENGTAYITKYNGTATSLTLPEVSNGFAVVGIKLAAFKDTTTLKTLVIPEGYEVIEGWQFYNCENLKTVSLPSTLKTIGKYVFFNNPLTKVTYNGTVDEFKAIDIADNGEEYPENYSLKECNITCTDWVYNPAEDTRYATSTVGLYKFKIYPDYAEILKYTGKETGVTLPVSAEYNGVVYPVTTVRTHAFYNNKTVKTLVIPEGYTTIEETAFECVDNLRKVTLPVSLKKIGANAFNLTDFPESTYKGTIAQFKAIKIAKSNTHLMSINVKCSDGTYKWPLNLDNAIIKVSKTKLVYNGKNQFPQFTITDPEGKELVKDKDFYFEINGKKNGPTKNVDEYDAFIYGKGYFGGSNVISFKILPKATKITNLTSSKGNITVKWSKRTVQVKGYQVQIATNSKFTKGKKTAKITKNTTIKKVFKNLKAGKTYYVRVRTYKYGSYFEGNLYSAWSGVKKVTVKKN